MVTPEEGDAWYRRNRDRLGLADPVTEMIERCHFSPKCILEIGCANGWRLARLRQRYRCLVTGIDLSLEAVEDGKRLHPEVGRDLWYGKFPDFRFVPGFDLIICGFFLYLASRADLFRIAQQIDYLLVDGGVVIIHDFYSSEPYANPYRHDSALLCYKQDYGRLFTGNPAYHLIECLIRGTETPEPKSQDDQVAVIALGKNVNAWPVRSS